MTSQDKNPPSRGEREVAAPLVGVGFSLCMVNDCRCVLCYVVLGCVMCGAYTAYMHRFPTNMHTFQIALLGVGGGGRGGDRITYGGTNQLWTKLIKFGQSRSNLINFERIWTILVKISHLV